jgi:hypothetical protein
MLNQDEDEKAKQIIGKDLNYLNQEKLGWLLESR